MPIYTICHNSALGQEEKKSSDSSQYVWYILKLYEDYWPRDAWAAVDHWVQFLFRCFQIIDWIDKFEDMIYCIMKEMTRNYNSSITFESI